MTKYIVHFRNAGFLIVEAESKQDAINQIDAVEDIEGCWEYDEDIFGLQIKMTKYKKDLK
jgi:hypothetical protein